MVNEDAVDEVLLKLLAGRIIAYDIAPYFSSLLHSMVPVERKGLGTFAVDKRYRMYYDPISVKKYSVTELAACWLHEAGHLWRAHGIRFDEMGQSPEDAIAWNKSGDGVINSDLRSIKVMLPEPDKRYYAEKNAEFPLWRSNMTTEELFEIARGKSNGFSQEKSDSSNNSPDKSEVEDNPQKNDSASDSDDKVDSEEKSERVKENSESSKENSSQGSDSSESNEEPSDSNGNQDASDTETSSSQQNQDTSETKTPSSQQNQSSENIDCGSGACGGTPRDYESDDAPSVDESTADQIRNQVAQDVIEYSKNRGNVPGSLIREAADLLDPLADWRKEINAVVRRVSATVVGRKDYTYSRPSRRRTSGGIIYPSMRSPRPPVIVIVLDTSGSMSKSDLARCLTEINAIIRRISRGQKYTVSVINCDAAASTVKTVKTIENFEIIGGGGTDMGVGIKAASELRPKPDLVITMTDGGTPWPIEIPKAAPRARYVALIVRNKKNRNSRFNSSDTIGTPQWMHTIVVED